MQVDGLGGSLSRPDRRGGVMSSVCVCRRGWRCQGRLRGFGWVPPNPKHSLGSYRALSHLVPLPYTLPPRTVSPPGFILPPSSSPTPRPLPDPAPAPLGLVRPLPHPSSTLLGRGPSDPLARRTHLGRNPSGACRTCAVHPRPALSSPPGPWAEAGRSPPPTSRPGLSAPRPSGQGPPCGLARPDPRRVPHSPGSRPRPSSRAQVSKPPLH